MIRSIHHSSKDRLGVVIIGATLPFPTDSGNAIRSLNLASRLARRHRVTYLARSTGDPDRDREACTRLRVDHGMTPRLVDDPIAAKRGIAFAGRLAANLAQKPPYSVATLVTHRLRKAVASFAREAPIDLWQAEGSPLMAALDAVAEQPSVLVAHNVESIIWRRYRDTETRPIHRQYIANQYRKYARFERRAFREATRVVAVSDVDARIIRDDFDAANVDVVDNGIDRGYFEAVHRRPEPGRLLFLGSLDWRPNQDALRLLLDQILPAVRRARPDVTLDIVGRRPPAWLVERAANDPAIALHADVPDVRPYLARAALLVVPLRIGGGSRLKILEALASGVPVVSTSVGAEGLKVEPGRDYLAADEPEAFTEQILSCLLRPREVDALTASTRRRVLDRYDWDRLADRMEAVWYDAVGRRRAGHVVSDGYAATVEVGPS